MLSMSKELLIGQLRQGNNGNEILSILDVVVAGLVTDSPAFDDNEPTSDTIEF